MVQLLLIKGNKPVTCSAILACILAGSVFLCPALAAPDKKKEPPKIEIPDLLMDGGRKLSYERAFSGEREPRLRAAHHRA